ncbi:MAG: asparagine synthetase B family protein, partial [Gemmiger sp.]
DAIRYHVDETRSLAEWQQLIRETFTGSVAAHQIADVEVGCFLSSGVDSSLVVNEVARGTPHVKSFSVGYAEPRYSELARAETFSRAIGVPFYPTTVSAEQFFAANRLIQWYLDEPMPNPAEVPLYFLAQTASRHVKVVLSGEGADELFGGYPLYCQGVHFLRYTERVPENLRRALGAAAERMPTGWRGRNFLRRGAMEPWQRFLRANYVFEDAARRNRVLRDPGQAGFPQEAFRPWFEKAEELDEPTLLQWVDMHTWLPNDILLKADRMSMAHSLELRVPFLDREMLDVALSLPLSCRCSGSETKIALRAAAAHSLPASVAGRKKLGFPVPLHDWLRQDRYYSMVRQAFTSETALRFFNVREILRLLEEHRRGRARNMTKIWSIYSFILWYELYFLSDTPPEEVYS